MQAISGIYGVQANAHGIALSLESGAVFSVEVLEQTLVRVRLRPGNGYREPRTWAIAPQPGKDVAWEGRLRDDLSGFSRPVARLLQDEDQVILATEQLTLSLQKSPLVLRWSNESGVVFASDRPTSAYFSSERTGGIRHCFERQRGERYYGLGDKTGPLNLQGRRLRTIGLDALGYDPRNGDPLYKHWPFVLTRAVNGTWYGVYYDTMATCTFDLGCEHDNYHELFRYCEIDDGDLDYYLMSGATPAEVIAQFVRLVGGTHLPPRWTLGFAQTAMGLADAPDAQAQLEDFMAKLKAEAIPCSSFHYGSGYSSIGKRRYVFTWNATKFPAPKTLNQRFQDAGIRLVANIKPCLLDDHPAYGEIQAAQGFIRDCRTGRPVVEQFWDGVGSHLDFTHPAALKWWQEQLAEQVLDYGIDAGWNDNNEYSIMSDGAVCDGFGAQMPIHRSRPLQALLMTRATFEAQAKRSPVEGNFTVTRGGMPGIQRYAQTWSGDNTTSWDTMRWNIRTGLQMSLSGIFNTGHDVGGFAGPVAGGELFVRWVQACCLNPRMVMNSWKAGGINNVPWLHPEMTTHVADAIRLRYQLLPYMWSLFEKAARSHLPVLRPTFFEFPDDPACYEDSDDFMLGDALLVAPVVEQGAIKRRVYLPDGPQAWFDFYSGEKFAAGALHEIDAPLNRLPLFARHGACVPLAIASDRVPRFDDPIGEVRQFGL
jgi:alpha-glucosidase